MYMVINILLWHFSLLLGSEVPGVFISRKSPKDYAGFALTFDELLSRERLVKMADNLFLDGEAMFGRLLITAGTLTVFTNLG